MNALAIMVALAAPVTHLLIEPWTGSDFQTTTDSAAKYRLEVDGRPNATVRLSARGVAHGWLAAFCTQRLCSPQQVDVQLPHSGNAVFQFELIRESESASTTSGATIVSSDGDRVRVPAASRQ